MLDRDLDRAFALAWARAEDLSRRLDKPSIMAQLAALPEATREAILSQLAPMDLARLAFHAEAWARGKQDPDPLILPAHRTLLFLGGRGSGKSFSALLRVMRRWRQGSKVSAIVGPTLREIERNQIEGTEEAPGILRLFPPGQRPEYKPHKGIIIWPLAPGTSGTRPISYVSSSESPEFRGQSLDTVWADEICKWRHRDTLWANIGLSTRSRPRSGLPLEIVVSSTPNGSRFFRELIADPMTATILGSSAENRANVDLSDMERRLAGTRLGRQELEGLILLDTDGALFSSSDLSTYRVRPDDVPEGLRIVIAIDPAIESNENNDPTGIVVAGVDQEGQVYVLDAVASNWTPEQWASKALELYDSHGANAIVCETNRGGQLVSSTVRLVRRAEKGLAASEALPIKSVKASNGKAPRAEPVGAMCERGMLHMVGYHAGLEEELTSWSPTSGARSPNLLDAMVWAAYYLCGLDAANPIPKGNPMQGFAAHVARQQGREVSAPDPTGSLAPPQAQHQTDLARIRAIDLARHRNQRPGRGMIR